jgi:uncharacterized membrane protein
MSDTEEPSTTGLDPRVAGVLAYLAGPVSGVLVLLAERTSPFVRFHAWQAILGLGGLGAIVILVMAVAVAAVLFSAAAFRALLVVSWTLWALWIACWIVCMTQAFTRRRWKLPIAGTYAERMTVRAATPSS